MPQHTRGSPFAGCLADPFMSAHVLKRISPTKWPWPLPALLIWTLAWSACALLGWLGSGPAGAATAGTCLGAGLALACEGRWRRAIVATGFPLSALAHGGAASWPAWAWLLLLLPLLLLYPVRAWRDAPFFPTPAAALSGLDKVVAQPKRVLDAGCGLGHGLRELHRLWPQAQIHGLEWSRPLSALASWRCPWAQVRSGDMWAADWSGYELVYLFQRPESMARAHRKAWQEMAPGGWLVSLEFEVPGETPAARLGVAGHRSVWIYRKPLSTAGALNQSPRLPITPSDPLYASAAGNHADSKTCS